MREKENKETTALYPTTSCFSSSFGDDNMSVRKVKGGYAVKHCHGAKKGKTIAKHKTKAQALRQHRAIQANKHRKKK